MPCCPKPPIDRPNRSRYGVFLYNRQKSRDKLVCTFTNRASAERVMKELNKDARHSDPLYYVLRQVWRAGAWHLASGRDATEE